MRSSISAAVFVAALLSACAQLPKEAPSSEVPAPVTVIKPKSPILPDQVLTEQILYEFLVAEVAGQRGKLDISTQAYLDLARHTRDPRVAQRATEVALFARAADQALEAATLWQQLDPESMQARQSSAALLVNSGKLEEARPNLEKLIAGEGDSAGAGFMHLNSLLARQADKEAVLKLVRELAAPYPNIPEGYYAVAQAAANAGHEDQADAAIQEAFRLRPGWEPAALFRAQMLQSTSVEGAVSFLRDFLKANPQAHDVRLAFARFLVSDKQYEAAREQFQRLLADSPDNIEVIMAVGLLSLQLNDLDAAEMHFKRALELGYKDENVVRMYLGQINEARQRYDEAATWYGNVSMSEQYLPAQVRLAALLARQGKLDEARKNLQELPTQNNQQRVGLIQAEAELLREAKLYQEVYDLLTRSLEKLPNYPELLYDHGMAAEKLDKLAVMEQDLRKLIQLKPDHAHAYNALGYTLADRTNRLEEAKQLVEQALKLSPDDPFIMDSMGWVFYRMGKLPDALDFLKRAFERRADPEIAAHLGEVLWVQGNRDEAYKLWSTAIKSNPENEALIAVIKKFKH
jgi:tetratricopeptide (TPR) repeat protein